MKILVLGTSHSGTIRLARPEIAQAFPGLDLTFYGLPGAAFLTARCEGGVFGPARGDRFGRAKARKWNDTPEIDLAPFERIFCVGDRFQLMTMARLIGGHDILEEPGRAERPLISTAAAEALIDGLVGARVAKLAALFGPDPRFCFQPAPFPLALTRNTGPGHERALSALATHASAARWIAFYEAAIARHLAAAGYRFLPQPEETRSEACFSLDRFARPPVAGAKKPDYRHLDAGYGAQAFADYARRELGLTPSPAADDPARRASI
ncbi:MAG: hypothetical protein AB7U46_16155 [Paenirhodobacter sp.]|uniref:hypothetical protein n=1 Tax=Paenirhodobacter sp. TaxID=1965326 RepID=UPI003D0ED1FA